MKFGIPGIFAAFFFTFLFYTSYQHSKLPVLDQVPNVPGFLVPVSTGKERVTSSGNRDASMHTQFVRRKATVDGFWASGRVMKETTHTTGFTTGVVEVYALSDVCVRICKQVEEVCVSILDGGSARSEYCAAYDGGNAQTNYTNSLDGGTAYTNTCAAVCAAVLDGGDAMAAYCHTYDGNLGSGVDLDGGNADTNVCEV
jgi:hypothetical protein